MGRGAWEAEERGERGGRKLSEGERRGEEKRRMEREVGAGRGGAGGDSRILEINPS